LALRASHCLFENVSPPISQRLSFLGLVQFTHLLKEADDDDADDDDDDGTTDDEAGLRMKEQAQDGLHVEKVCLRFQLGSVPGSS
jgi:hypothetical protein